MNLIVTDELLTSIRRNIVRMRQLRNRRDEQQAKAVRDNAAFRQEEHQRFIAQRENEGVMPGGDM